MTARAANSASALFSRRLLPWLVPLLRGRVAGGGLGGNRSTPSFPRTGGSRLSIGASRGDRATLAASLGSLHRALLGLLLGGGLGLLFGIANGLTRTGERLFDTSLQMLRTVPHLALIPLAIIWFGIGEPSKLFLISLGTFFPVYLNTFHGIRSVDAKLIEAARIYGLRGPGLIFGVILPGALPSVLVGLRYALGVMWVTLIVAETIATQSGIGFLINEAREFMQTPVILAGILIYALLGKLADDVTRQLERLCLPWHPSQRLAS
ncbi:MAG: ABC transporter permease subunit [Nibricoccus sp.]